jgi:hypothetical protein
MCYFGSNCDTIEPWTKKEKKESLSIEYILLGYMGNQKFPGQKYSSLVQGVYLDQK